jgi:hypothetical protein
MSKQLRRSSELMSLGGEGLARLASLVNLGDVEGL